MRSFEHFCFFNSLMQVLLQLFSSLTDVFKSWEVTLFSLIKEPSAYFLWPLVFNFVYECTSRVRGFLLEYLPCFRITCRILVGIYLLLEFHQVVYIWHESFFAVHDISQSIIPQVLRCFTSYLRVPEIFKWVQQNTWWSALIFLTIISKS